MSRSLFAALALAVTLTASACIAQVPPTTPVLTGTYQVDPTHVSVTFKILHMGLSNYTARFAKADATITYDAADPAKSTLSATVDPASIRTDYPFAEKVDFDKELRGPDWFNVAAHPTITFKSTSIEVTGPKTAKIKGDLTLLGVTKPAVFDTTLNAALESHPFAKVPTLGFSAVAKIDRTAFGLSKYAPLVSGEVTLLIEAEFQKK